MKKIKLLRKQFGVWFTLISMLTFLLRKVNSDSYIYIIFFISTNIVGSVKNLV